MYVFRGVASNESQDFLLANESILYLLRHCPSLFLEDTLNRDHNPRGVLAVPLSTPGCAMAFLHDFVHCADPSRADCEARMPIEDA